MAKLLVTVLTILCLIPLFATQTHPAGMYVHAPTYVRTLIFHSIVGLRLRDKNWVEIEHYLIAENFQ